MKLREVLNQLPIVYIDKEHLKRDEEGKIVNWPTFPCWIQCKYYTWDIDVKVMDFVEKEAPFWFDGKDFHQTTDLYNADGADWIFELGKPAKLL